MLDHLLFGRGSLTGLFNLAALPSFFGWCLVLRLSTAFLFFSIRDREGVKWTFFSKWVLAWYVVPLPLRARVGPYLPKVDVSPGAPQVACHEFLRRIGLTYVMKA